MDEFNWKSFCVGAVVVFLIFAVWTAGVAGEERLDDTRLMLQKQMCEDSGPLGGKFVGRLIPRTHSTSQFTLWQCIVPIPPTPFD